MGKCIIMRKKIISNVLVCYEIFYWVVVVLFEKIVFMEGFECIIGSLGYMEENVGEVSYCNFYFVFLGIFFENVR